MADDDRPDIYKDEDEVLDPAWQPRAINEKLTPRRYAPDRFTQTDQERAPVRAVRIKGDQLRAVMRRGDPLDWSDIYERYVDLWQEARLVIWRAKRAKAGRQVFDPVKKKMVQGFIPDDRLVLSALDSTRAILDSLIRVRREAGHEASGIPRWAIERIELALRQYPDALNHLLRELAEENRRQPIEVK